MQWKSKNHNHDYRLKSLVRFKILGINDFHGQLSTGRTVGNRPVGSAPVLAAYLKYAETRSENPAFIVHAGDHVGATPPVSALLKDEPSISFLNLIANDFCALKIHINQNANQNTKKTNNKNVTLLVH